MIAGQQTMQRAMKTPMRSERVQSIASEIISAFNALADKNDSAVADFWEAFKERASVPELDESKGIEGLAPVLADLLWRTVPRSYLDSGRGSSTKAKFVDSSIKNDFQSALRRVADNYPHVLLSIKADQEEDGESMLVHLRALLVLYSDNRAAYPL